MKEKTVKDASALAAAINLDRGLVTTPVWYSLAAAAGRGDGPKGEMTMVPVEVTAFGLLALCVILLALVQGVVVWKASSTAPPLRVVLIVVPIIVAVLAIYIWGTTRMP